MHSHFLVIPQYYVKIERLIEKSLINDNLNFLSVVRRLKYFGSFICQVSMDL